MQGITIKGVGYCLYGSGQRYACKVGRKKIG